MQETAKTLKPILFVDDDPNVLTGLRNVLRTKRDGAKGGGAAPWRFRARDNGMSGEEQS
jgi:hypothetical protein